MRVDQVCLQQGYWYHDAFFFANKNSRFVHNTFFDIVFLNEDGRLSAIFIEKQTVENRLWATSEFLWAKKTINHGYPRALHDPAVAHLRRVRDCSDSSTRLPWRLVTAVTHPAVTHQHPSRARVQSLSRRRHYLVVVRRSIRRAFHAWLN